MAGFVADSSKPTMETKTIAFKYEQLQDINFRHDIIVKANMLTGITGNCSYSLIPTDETN